MEPQAKFNKWEIIVNTSLFSGTGTAPIRPVVTLPVHAVETINRVIIAAINYALYKDDNVDCTDDTQGTQALELVVNRMIQQVIQQPIIRADLYPHEGGLCALINVKYLDRDIEDIKEIADQKLLEAGI